MYKKIIIFFIITFLSANLLSTIDFSVTGRLIFADGLYRIPIIWIDALRDQLSINFFESHPGDPYSIREKDLPHSVKAVLKKGNKEIGNVGIYFDLIWDSFTDAPVRMPNSPIKFAYTMIEASSIPWQWVERINTYFDGIIVPDEFLVKVYQKAGITKPIFVLPIPMYLKDFLNKPIKVKQEKRFVFGTSALFMPRKNQDLIIKAFAKKFGNNPKYLLKLHGRAAEEDYLKKIQRLISRLKLNNVQVIHTSFDQNQYIKYLQSLDCYVFVSKGEGFSLTPREALATGIPCILTNSTSHTYICDTGFVKSIKAIIKEPAYYPIFKQQCGYNFNCDQTDLEDALFDVVMHHEKYQCLALKARGWVKQYELDNLKQYMKTIIKPEKIYLGEANRIEVGRLMTNCPELVKKYTLIMKQ